MGGGGPFVQHVNYAKSKPSDDEVKVVACPEDFGLGVVVVEVSGRHLTDLHHCIPWPQSEPVR